MPSGSTHTETCLCALTNGQMLCVGSSSTPPLSLEQESSCGRKATLLTQLLRKLTKWCFQFLITMLAATRKCWLYQLLRVGNRALRSLMEQTTPPQLSSMYLPMAVVFKVPLLTSWDKTSLRCSMFGLRTSRNKSSSCGRLHGVSPPVPLVP